MGLFKQPTLRSGHCALIKLALRGSYLPSPRPISACGGAQANRMFGPGGHLADCLCVSAKCPARSGGEVCSASQMKVGAFDPPAAPSLRGRIVFQLGLETAPNPRSSAGPELQYRRALPSAKMGEQNDLAVGKFQRVVERAGLVHVHVPKPRHLSGAVSSA